LPLPLLLTHVVVQPVTVIDRVPVPSLFKDGNDVALLDDWLAGVWRHERAVLEAKVGEAWPALDSVLDGVDALGDLPRLRDDRVGRTATV